MADPFTAQGATKADDKSADDSFKVSAPQVSLPKGGGALRGIGEKFAVNPVTGTGSLSVPIALSPGRSGFGPALSLTYDSGTGNGPFGLGWSLGLPQITRRTDKGLPQYDDAAESDVFILSGAEDLVPVLVEDEAGNWSRVPASRNGYVVWQYRPRIEGPFSRIERWTRIADGDSYWRSISRENITSYYGRTAASRIADPADPTRIFSWMIDESRDDKGNVTAYIYVAENQLNIDLTPLHERNRTPGIRSANRYLKAIRYGNTVPAQPATDTNTLSFLFEAVFDYGEGHLTPFAPDADGRSFATASLAPQQPWAGRQDPFSRYRACFEIRSYRLCRRVLMFHHFPEALGAQDVLVRATEFTFDAGLTASFITAVTQSGFVRQNDGSYLKSSLPAVQFEYSQAEIQNEVREVDPQSLANLPAAVDGASYQWLDLDGDGAPGVLASANGGWYYKRNVSPLTFASADGIPSIMAFFDPLTEVATLPGFAQGGAARHQFMDLAGDGRHDCVVLERPYAGFYKRSDDAGWEDFTPLDSMPNVDWHDPNLRFVDLNGDGRADVLITEQSVFTWYGSMGETGFAEASRAGQPMDEEQGPAVIFADGTQTIFLADMSGDGLSDLVRIRNGSVCYWPNIGYGAFGAKIALDNAPWFEAPDLFDPKRLRLADIDGSGTTDILYLSAAGVQLYFNRNGNACSDATPLAIFPGVDALTSVQAMDLLGNGTSCLVWMSPLPNDARRSMRYVDLMGGQKPHLLLRSLNNLGAETRLHYAPSTKFCLADRAAGTPWMTRLPFPVQVVERVETYDRVSRNRFVSRYAYHHGYYDGFEREFRGFGMVEQWDTEELGVLTTSGSFPDATNIDAASYVPPVLTRTWFHLGADALGPEISRIFQQEYWREPGIAPGQAAAMQLPDTVLPAGLSPDEIREAIRALKGAMLRQEVYAVDGGAAALLPYTVTEQNLAIRRLQPLGANRHAVFFTHSCESVNFQYERKSYAVAGQNLADPRVAHELVLAIDDYGNVLQSASAAYGRRYDDADASLTAQDRACQKKLHLTATENLLTHAILAADAYRAPLPAEARHYEIINAIPASAIAGVTNLFRVAEIAAILGAAGDGKHDLPFEDVAAAGATEQVPYRRLIAQQRTLYRKDDLSAGLPLGVMESHAIPDAGYRLAFTPGLLAQYQREAAALMPDPAAWLGGAGGYSSGDAMTVQGIFPSTDPAGAWWIASGRSYFSIGATDSASLELNTAQAHFFLPCRFQDPFGNSTAVRYDPHDLLVLQTVDALGNTVTIGVPKADGSIANGNDYRLLQPALLTDPNGNRSQVAFDALGLVAGTAVMGKTGETLGDSLGNFVADLTQSQIDAFIADPQGSLAATLLGNASTRFVYDLFRNQLAKPDVVSPAFAATIGRETHMADLAPGQASRLQVILGFSDGFGREIQKKMQADPGPLSPGGAMVASRWAASGWTIFNNKGKPVRQYEPFFDDSPDFKFGVTIGVSPILFYDPAQRMVATLHPDHSWEKVIFDPWRQENWDANDTVLITDPAADPDLGPFASRLPQADYAPGWYAARSGGALGGFAQDAAQKAAAHAGTPAIAYFDTLGRPFLTIAWNRIPSSGGIVEDRLRTATVYDVTGKALAITDALGRKVMGYFYDMLGQRIHSASMDAGEGWALADCTTKPLLHWDSLGRQFRYGYDALHRPTQFFVQTGSTEILAETIVYGEGQPNDQGLNLRGKIHQSFDGAGIATHSAYDFKGNPLSSTRQLLQDYNGDINWQATPALETEIFTNANSYDALNRPLTLTTPDASIHRPVYNAVGLLAGISVNLQGAAAATSFVTLITYDAKGRRAQIAYGNGATTTYQYDPESFRLTGLTTTRAADQAWLQDLAYAYDPVGNITLVQDNADIQNTIYFRNQRVEPSSAYVYDAVYRLIQATGREHLGQTQNQLNAPAQVGDDDGFRMNLPQPGDGLAMGNYTERYQYDNAGNMLAMAHLVSSGNWTRFYTYDPASNRLLATSLPGDTAGQCSAKYSYDAHGNMLTMPHLPLMQWDSKNQLRATQQQVVTSGQGVRTYYVYDPAGQRIRKVTENQHGVKTNERIYLGNYEIYREYAAGGSVTLERETLHVMDDRQRVVLIETGTQAVGNIPPPVIRYQFGNHLGSSNLELDEKAQIISYEEYFPYGSTAYQAGSNATEVSLKRYRFTGKERDSETGLYCFGARYYAPWMGRWTSCDPLGLVDGPNVFQYCLSSPVKNTDPTGKSMILKEVHGQGLSDEDRNVLAQQLRENIASDLGVQTSYDERTGTITAIDINNDGVVDEADIRLARAALHAKLDAAFFSDPGRMWEDTVRTDFGAKPERSLLKKAHILADKMFDALLPGTPLNIELRQTEPSGSRVLFAEVERDTTGGRVTRDAVSFNPLDFRREFRFEPDIDLDGATVSKKPGFSPLNVLTHELAHEFLNLKDPPPTDKKDKVGDTVKVTNIFEAALGINERSSYGGHALTISERASRHDPTPVYELIAGKSGSTAISRRFSLEEWKFHQLLDPVLGESRH